MEKSRYKEMEDNLSSIMNEFKLSDRKIFLFGHCNATLGAIDLLLRKGLQVEAILDNSSEKQEVQYKGVRVVYPQRILDIVSDNPKDTSIVLIASRFYASMKRQLQDIGYDGPVRKLIDYNSYADYSLSDETIARMTAREKRGEELLSELGKKYPGSFKVFCPFNALGDVYFMASYYPAFAKIRDIKEQVFCVPSKTLADVIHMFDEDYKVEAFEQKDLDAMIQASLYTHDKDSFIAHQDRPYVIDLHKTLYIKKIPLEQVYCCGVYGLPKDTEPVAPRNATTRYKELENIPKGRSVIFSPYAKSVTAIDSSIWQDAVSFYNAAGYKCYTNVVGDEAPLDCTESISPSLFELKSVVERAGTFIGIRSGLCDILREAKAKKIALYPDYYYSDTRWKAIEMYYLEQFDHNIVATESIEWAKL